MNRFLLIIGLAIGLAGRPVLAQVVWHRGNVTLITGTRLSGEVCYQAQADILLFRASSGKWLTYAADELWQFQYIDVVTNSLHHFVTYALVQPTGQTVPVILEELIAGVAVPLLQLPVWHGNAWAADRNIPQDRQAGWPVEQPWYIWIDGQLTTPVAFIKSEIDRLIATSPDAVKRWDAGFPRPIDPKSLARWLGNFNRRLMQAQKFGEPGVVLQVPVVGR